MLNLPDPSQAVMGGMQNTLALSNVMSQRNLAEQQAMQVQQAREQQAAMQAELGELSKNPSPAALSSMMVKYPQLSEQFKRTHDVLSTEEQKAKVSTVMPIYAALESGNTEIATRLLEENATALENSGKPEEAKTARVMLEIAKTRPDALKASSGMFLAHAMGPEKFTETFTKMGGESRAVAEEGRKVEKAPFELSEAQSKATKAAVDAKFAESNAVKDLEKKGWDITKIREDIGIAKENSRIAAMNAAISREGNALKKQEMGLKLQEMKDKRDESVRGKVAEADSARGDMDNFLNTVDRFLKTSVDKDGKPTSTIRAASGPLDSIMPTMQSDVADLEALAETIGSQAFMAQIPKMKGTGALSEGEGKKLQASLQNFSLKQSPERLIENMKEAQRLILKGRSNLAKKYGIPDSVPDTPQAAPGASDIDALLKKYGG